MNTFDRVNRTGCAWSITALVLVFALGCSRTEPAPQDDLPPATPRVETPIPRAPVVPAVPVAVVPPPVLPAQSPSPLPGVVLTIARPDSPEFVGPPRPLLPEPTPAEVRALIPRPSIAQRKLLEGHTGVVRSVVFSPDGQLVLSGSDDRTARLWDVQTGLEVARLEGHKGWVLKVAFSPDGATAATASSDGTIHLWDVKTRKELKQLAHKGMLASIAFSHDGQKLLSTGSEPEVLVWDLQEGKIERRLMEGKLAQPVPVAATPLDVTYSWSGKSALAIRPSGLLSWNLSNGRQRPPLAACAALAVWSKGPYALLGNLRQVNEARLGVVQLCHLDQRRVLGEFTAHSGAVLGLAFTPDGGHALSAGADGLILYWNLAEALKLVGNRMAPQVWVKEPTRAFHGHVGAVMAVAASPSGRLAASAGADKTVRLWDLKDGIPLGQLGDLAEWVEWEVWTVKYRYVLVGGYDDYSLRLWDVLQKREIRRLEGNKSQVLGLALNEEGTLAASAGLDGTVVVWDTTTGERRWQSETHRTAVRRVAFQPSGNLLVSGGSDGFARVWRVEDGNELYQVPDHAGGVTALCFSPDGMQLLTGASDGMVRRIEAATGAELDRIDTLKGPVVRLAFSPDGRQILVGNTQRAVEIWDIESRRPLSESATQTEWVRTVLTTWDFRDTTRIVTGPATGSGSSTSTGQWITTWRTVRTRSSSGRSSGGFTSSGGTRTTTTTRTVIIRGGRRR